LLVFKFLESWQGTAGQQQQQQQQERTKKPLDHTTPNSLLPLPLLL
jgi:hypothetical protein